mgnify:CR=1 FL=1
MERACRRPGSNGLLRRDALHSQTRHGVCPVCRGKPRVFLRAAHTARIDAGASTERRRLSSRHSARGAADGGGRDEVSDAPRVPASAHCLCDGTRRSRHEGGCERRRRVRAFLRRCRGFTVTERGVIGEPLIVSFERSPGSRFSTPADDGVGTERSNSAVTIEEV